MKENVMQKPPKARPLSSENIVDKALKSHNSKSPAMIEQLMSGDSFVSNLFSEGQDAIGSSPVPDIRKPEKEGYIVIAGEEFELDRPIKINPDLITSTFKWNKRKTLGNIEDLAHNFHEVGRNTEPVLVRPLPDGSGLEVIKGRRRTAAAKLTRSIYNNNFKITAIVREVPDFEAIIDATMENLHRIGLNPWETADQLKVLLDMGICEKVSDLTPYISRSLYAVKRTAVYYHLAPADIDPMIRNLIDEDAPVTLSQIRKLSDFLKNIEVPISDLLTDLKSALDVSKLETNKFTVPEVVKALSKIQYPGQKVDLDSEQILKSSNGKKVCSIKKLMKGGATIKVDKGVSAEKIDELIDFIEKWKASV